MRITSGVTATDKWKADTPIHLDPSTTPDQMSLSSLMLCSSCATRRPRVSRKHMSCVTQFSTPTGMGDVAHYRGSNIRQSWLHVHSIQLRGAVNRRASKEIATETMFTSSKFFFMVSNAQLLKSRDDSVEIGPQVFWQLIVPGGLTSAGVHGFQGIQTVTLSRWHKLPLFLVLEFVLPIRAFLTTIARHERIIFELVSRKLSGSFQPSLEKKFSWLCTCPDRSLTNFSVWIVPRSSSISSTSPLSFIRMFAPSWRMIVIGVNGGMNCCLPSVDVGSSSTRNRITPFTPTIPAVKSRTCTTLAVPIPPHVAIMLVGTAPSQSS